MKKRIIACIAAVMLIAVALTGAMAETYEIVNCNDWVSLRTSPSTSASRLTVVPLGSIVSGWKYNNQWIECDYRGMHGYILSAYCDSTNYLGSMRVMNCKQFVTLRAEPSTKAASITKIAKGEWVDATYYNSQFYRCTYKGMTGYILSNYLGY